MGLRQQKDKCLVCEEESGRERERSERSVCDMATNLRITKLLIGDDPYSKNADLVFRLLRWSLHASSIGITVMSAL